MVIGIIMVFCYGTIFTFFSMQDSNKARNSIITFTLALAIILGGLYVYGSLQEPEFISRMVMQADGSYEKQDGIPNSKYNSGTKRTIYTFVNACIPSSQAYIIARYESEFYLLPMVCLLGVSTMFTTVGVISFKKKDIK